MLGMVCGALCYWFNDYNEAYVMGIHIYLILGVSVFISALGLSLYYKNSTYLSPLFLCVGVIVAALGRIFDDLRIDPTDHNLFPFEIMSLLVIAVPVAFLGHWLGTLVHKARR
mgnify:CR=1 FL=1